MAAYEVWIKGFAPEVADPVPELMRLFRIPEDRARKLAESVPVAVKKNATHGVAEKFSRGLEKIGALVEIRAAGETSGTWSERPPSRSARSVAPSRQRTGRGLERLSSSPELPAFDAMPADGLPRRRTASGQLEAVLDLPPRRPSSPSMEALDAAPPAPRRRSQATMPATSAVVASVLAPAPNGPEEAALPRRQKATAFLGSTAVSEPAGEVGLERPPPPPAELELPPPRSIPPARSAPAPLPRPPRRAAEPPAPMSGVPRSVIPAPLPGAPRVPPASFEPAPASEPARRRRGTLAPIAVAVGGVLIIAWRLSARSSIFQGNASWIFGVWLEASALAMIAAGGMSWLAAREGKRDEAFSGQGRLALALVFPVAFLVNWAVASTGDEREVIPGSLEARIETLNTLADACERTAKDAASCKTCCQSEMVFDGVCACQVPWRCRDGDGSAEACGRCCRDEAGADVTHTLVRGRGCVCDDDGSLTRP